MACTGRRCSTRCATASPYAIIEVENRAIGGFTAPSLCRTAASDLYPTTADLIVFHDYGGEQSGELERMIRGIRKFTTADILIYTHTIAWSSDPEGLERRNVGGDNSAAVNRYLAQKYDCELVEARDEWREFLEMHDIGINEYMGNKRDSNVHPNREGHTLLAQLCLRHFQFNTLYPGGWADRVQWIDARRALEEVQDEVVLSGNWQTDHRYGLIAKAGECSMELAFRGNRVDLVPHPNYTGGTFSMLIDGKPPAEFPELYAYTKVDGVRPGHAWPVFRRIGLPAGTPPVPQTWTATITACDLEAKTFSYSLSGSVTGPDGRRIE